MKKLFSFAVIGLLAVLLLAACGGGGGNNDAGDTTDNEGGGEQTAENFSWRLASNHPEEHAVTKSLRQFTELAEENSDGSVNVELHHSGVLGEERSVIELVKSGTLEMARVSASALEGFEEAYSIFNLPYVFQSEEHYYDVMDNSDAVKEIFEKSKDTGWFAIGWYSGGSRSIYTTSKAVSSPEDMKGLKIRVQESPTAIAMIEAMGGSPTPMSFGEVYTALQQGIIDGAENNELGLTANKHGEVAKHWSQTDHQYSPDVLIISTRAWEALSEDQQQAVMEAARTSSDDHKDRWAEATEAAVKQAKEEMNVTFNDIDKTPFIESAAPIHENFKDKSEDNARWFEDFQNHLND
ncbi:TRAP transporter substrate-binding protein [Bacillus sp. B15-48]|uniref:TRAP transporter substrate-binding protein n=1 Tax=Bacillus sp. B15-48 TaxID=1548601 RepID=UPI0019400F70|nr:TRAP transporter substrate-binding protein [Bacillus sp. B15-48]MBM4761493.1 DctP family TRAP transporter solute-binding subunit [Bacillus sp. B15-48]